MDYTVHGVAKSQTPLSDFHFHSEESGFPGSARDKEPTGQCRRRRDMGSIPGLGISPGGEHGNPLQYSCLENPMDRGAWWAIVHGVTKSRTQLK